MSGRPKRDWPPCAVCGDPGGRSAGTRSRTPDRFDLARFGVPGLGCRRCYARLRWRQLRGIALDPMGYVPFGVRAARVAHNGPVRSVAAPAGRPVPAGALSHPHPGEIADV